MGFIKAKIKEIEHQIEVLERAVLEYPDNMDLVKTGRNINALKLEQIQWQGLLDAQQQLFKERVKNDVKIN